MVGGSHKFGRGGGGRGGGGGAAKRNSFPPPPPQRPSSAGRLSLSSSGGRNVSSATAAAAPQSEESFSLVTGDPPSFAAIIRLAPDLVDEIRRVEAHGGAARIKFDSNPSNPSANVIDVGGKEFRFTWSHEMGGLCDIYEERQSGEDGNGLLIESGCTWRKLNVQRVLDESTKKHVKMRSAEYEQKLKSRKAIVLDQCNPSMKSQMKALAAAEANPWKFKHNKDFKKRNFEPSQVGGHPKPVHKSGVSSATAAKGRCSTSPLPSPQNQSASLVSPSIRGNATESQTIAEDPATIQARPRANAANSDKDFPARASGSMQEAAAHRDDEEAGVSDLRNLLITLLKENPNGMTIKALGKAVGDVTSNSAGKIEPILKKIAIYEPPGRYTLKPGVELESFKRSSPDGGSSPEDNHQKQFDPEDNHGGVTAQDSGFAAISPAEDLEEQVPLNDKLEEESNLVEKIDTSRHVSNLFGDDELPDNNDGQAASSSDSESDSDSDSSSSDSDSDRSSDSDDDSSSNSKEAYDVDVDIMSDDVKEAKKPQDTERELSTMLVSLSMPEAMYLQNGRNGDQDGYASEDIDIEKDFPDDHEAQLATAPSNLGIATDKLRIVSADHDQHRPSEVMDVVNEQGVEGEFRHEHPGSFVKYGVKPKRRSNVIPFEQNAENVKRFKAGSTVQPSLSGHMGSQSHTLGSPPKFSADITYEDNHENHDLQMSNHVNIDDNANPDFGMQRGHNYLVPGKAAVESLNSGRRPPARSYNIETADKLVKNPPHLGIDSKYQDAKVHTHESLSKQQDKGFREAQDEQGSSNEKANGKFKESPLDQKHSLRLGPHNKKHSEFSKKSQLAEASSRLHTGSSPKDSVKVDFDNSPADRRRLQREVSDLELGELREPLPEEPESTRRQFERAGSFKQSETKLGTSASRNADLKGKLASKPTTDPGNTSPPNSGGVPKNSESLTKRRSPQPYGEDNYRPHKGVQSQQQQSRGGRAEMGSLSNKGEEHNRLGHNETVADQGADVEGYGETLKHSHINLQREDSRQEHGSYKEKGNKSRKSKTFTDTGDKRRDVSSIEGCNDKRKRSESSSDENTSFSKYEKEKPELKAPIKNFSQYKEYVQEYREKYETYCSLNKILESYRNEFQKLGMDLDSAKGRDTERYYGILAQLRESYRQCGPRHKRLKKIFLVLHEELKHLKQKIKEFAIDYMKD